MLNQTYLEMYNNVDETINYSMIIRNSEKIVNITLWLLVNTGVLRP